MDHHPQSLWSLDIEDSEEEVDVAGEDHVEEEDEGDSEEDESEEEGNEKRASTAGAAARKRSSKSSSSSTKASHFRCRCPSSIRSHVPSSPSNPDERF